MECRDVRILDTSHFEHTNHHLTGPPLLLLHLFGLWALKRLADCGAPDNQNLERYLQFRTYLAVMTWNY